MGDSTEPDNLDLLLAAVSVVRDPELGDTLVNLKMIRELDIDDEAGTASMVVELTTPTCPLKDRIEKDLREASLTVKGIRDVVIRWEVQKRPPKPESVDLPNIARMVAVGSGKGGVGKSTISLALALAVRDLGHRVGLLDIDVFGPNLPTLTGLETAKAQTSAGRAKPILPIEYDGLRLMSMGFLVDVGRAVMWRGPMLHQAIRRFLADVDWGELDLLLVDLPPGTGDTQLSLTQFVDLDGALMVSTPQALSVHDVRKGIAMFRRRQVEILGLIENMAYFEPNEGGPRYAIFGEGALDKFAEDFRIPIAARIPILPAAAQLDLRDMAVRLADVAAGVMNRDVAVKSTGLPVL